MPITVQDSGIHTTTSLGNVMQLPNGLYLRVEKRVTHTGQHVEFVPCRLSSATLMVGGKSWYEFWYGGNAKV